MREITNCRVCENDQLTSLVNLGNIAVSDFLDNPDDEVFRLPLHLVRCESCTLVQLKHTADPDILYREYWYKSGVNPVIKDDLAEIVEVALNEIDVEPGDVFLDIGANDGTLLQNVPKFLKRIGIDPAETHYPELKENCDIAVCDYWNEEVFVKLRESKAKIITAIGMFYDSDTPNQFVGDIKKVLADDGILIAQMMTLKPMYKLHDFGNICHEHIEFYTYQSLVTLFENNGLEIYKVEENPINGGSYRLFIRHLDKGSVSFHEWNYNWDMWKKFVDNNKEKTVQFIKGAVASGKKVYCYGASTKGQTILDYYGLGPDLITGAADRNPVKHGKYMVTGVPIVSEEEARKDADYFFVLPYGFINYFMEREQEWRDNGGKFIVSIPQFQIL